MEKLTFIAKLAYAEKMDYGCTVAFADSKDSDPKEFVVFQRASEGEESKTEHVTIRVQSLDKEGYNTCKNAVLSSDKFTGKFVIESKEYQLEVNFEKTVVSGEVKEVLTKILESKLSIE